MDISVKRVQDFRRDFLSDFYITIFDGPSCQIWLSAPKSRERNYISRVFDFLMVALWGLLSSILRWLTMPENSAENSVKSLDPPISICGVFKVGYIARLETFEQYP